MVVEVLAVGTELLMGQVANTDAQFISRCLRDVGASVLHHQVVGDNPGRLKEALALAASRSDGVILTGGLGPTPDDLTKETLAEFLGLDMVEDPQARAELEAYFRDGRPMTPNNLKQASFPRGASILPNPYGTAPGCIVEQADRFYVVLPGPPRELQPMMTHWVTPYLVRRSDAVLATRMLRLIGIGESTMAYEIRDLLDAQTNPTIAPYIGDGDLMLRITARVAPGEDAEALLDPVVEEISRRLGRYIFSQKDQSLPEVVVETLQTRGETLAVAESCTGGLLSSMLVGVAGVSAVFLEGAVTYSNDAKIRRLGVRKETLDAWGAVSRETALEMAQGIRAASGASWGLATTGIAGPDGGTPEKPVGTVWVALAGEGVAFAKCLHIPRERQVVRRNASLTLLKLILDAMQGRTLE